MPTPTPTPSLSPISLGAYLHDAAFSKTQMATWIAKVGTTPKVFQWFLDWGHYVNNPTVDYAGDGSFNTNYWDAAIAAAPGVAPLMTWEPFNYAGSFPQATYSLANINAGHFDATINGMASNIAAWGKPLLVRLAHEMNGSWYPWGLGVNGNTAAQYITMWRKVVTAFRMAGASNVRWVWCPNVDQATMAQFYPGDDYVDWIALDGYNKGAVNGNTWITFQNMLISSYNQICAITTKPLMIAETASNETGGDKPQWIRDMFAMIPTAFPRIRAVIWYDYNAGGDYTEMAVDSTAASLSAFAAAMASPDNRAPMP